MLFACALAAILPALTPPVHANSAVVRMIADPPSAAPGDAVRLRLRVENQLTAKRSATLRARLPAAALLLDPGRGVHAGNPDTLFWAMGDLSAGEIREATLIVRIDPLFTGAEAPWGGIQLDWTGAASLSFPPAVLPVHGGAVTGRLRLGQSRGEPLEAGETVRVIFDAQPGASSTRSATVTFALRGLAPDADGIAASHGAAAIAPETGGVRWTGAQEPVRIAFAATAAALSPGEFAEATATLAVEDSPSRPVWTTRAAAASPRRAADRALLSGPAAGRPAAIELLRGNTRVSAGVRLEDARPIAFDQTAEGDWVVLEEAGLARLRLIDSQSGSELARMPLPGLQPATNVTAARDGSFLATGADGSGRGLLLRIWPGAAGPVTVLSDPRHRVYRAVAEQDGGEMLILAETINAQPNRNRQLVRYNPWTGALSHRVTDLVSNPVDLALSGGRAFILNAPEDPRTSAAGSGVVVYDPEADHFDSASDTQDAFLRPVSIAADAEGGLLIADAGNETLYQLSAAALEMSGIADLPPFPALVSALPADRLPRRAAIPHRIDAGGGSGSIPVRLQTADGVAGVDIVVRVNSTAVRLLNPQPGPFAAGFIFSATAGLSGGQAASFSAARPAAPVGEASGTIAWIPFQVARPSSLPGRVAVEIVEARAYDEDAFALPLSTRHGSLVSDPDAPDGLSSLRADVNRDGRVDWRDLLWIAEQWHLEEAD